MRFFSSRCSVKDLSWGTVRLPSRNKLLSCSGNLFFEFIERARLPGSVLLSEPALLVLFSVFAGRGPSEPLPSPCLRFCCFTERLSFISGRFELVVSMNLPNGWCACVSADIFLSELRFFELLLRPRRQSVYYTSSALLLSRFV